MAYTAARVTQNGLPYRIVGANKETVTDVTWGGATASEAVTAADLGLNSVYSGHAIVQTGVASATGVDATVVPTATGATVGLNTAAGAGTGQDGSVVRVFATGY